MSSTSTQIDVAAVREAAGSVPDPEIRRTLGELDLRPGVRTCRIDIHDHFIAADISQQVNEGDVTEPPSWL